MLRCLISYMFSMHVCINAASAARTAGNKMLSTVSMRVSFRKKHNMTAKTTFAQRGTAAAAAATQTDAVSLPHDYDLQTHPNTHISKRICVCVCVCVALCVCAEFKCGKQTVSLVEKKTIFCVVCECV